MGSGGSVKDLRVLSGQYTRGESSEDFPGSDAPDASIRFDNAVRRAVDMAAMMVSGTRPCASISSVVVRRESPSSSSKRTL